MSVILATPEAEIGRSQSETCLTRNENFYLKNKLKENGLESGSSGRQFA
jgi:hypothetical protein